MLPTGQTLPKCHCGIETWPHFLLMQRTCNCCCFSCTCTAPDDHTSPSILSPARSSAAILPCGRRLVHCASSLLRIHLGATQDPQQKRHLSVTAQAVLSEWLPPTGWATGLAQQVAGSCVSPARGPRAHTFQIVSCWLGDEVKVQG